MNPHDEAGSSALNSAKPYPLESRRARVTVAIVAAGFGVVGVISVWRGGDGMGTFGLFIGAAILVLIALTGQIPLSPWAHFEREAVRWRELRQQEKRDAIMASLAQIAVAQRVTLEFDAMSQMWRWDALIITEDHREIGIQYVGADSVLPDNFAETLRPERVESAVVVIEDQRDHDERWNSLRRAAASAGQDLTCVSLDDRPKPKLLIGLSSPAFGELYTTLHTLAADNVGAVGNSVALGRIDPAKEQPGQA